MNDPNDPRNSLALVAQFLAEYLLTFAEKPATREAVQVQVKDALQRLDTALQERAVLVAPRPEAVTPNANDLS